MSGHGSTTAAVAAKRAAPWGVAMGRLFFLVVLLGLLVLGLGFLALGAFPPEPRPAPIHKVMPNDRFKQ